MDPDEQWRCVVEWADLASAGKDVEKILSYWSDDALLIFPGQPVLEGKAAIRAYVSASLKTPGFKIHWVSEKPVFSPDGKLAYMRGTDRLTVPGPNGTPTTLLCPDATTAFAPPQDRKLAAGS